MLYFCVCGLLGFANLLLGSLLKAEHFLAIAMIDFVIFAFLGLFENVYANHYEIVQCVFVLIYALLTCCLFQQNLVYGEFLSDFKLLIAQFIILILFSIIETTEKHLPNQEGVFVYQSFLEIFFDFHNTLVSIFLYNTGGYLTMKNTQITRGKIFYADIPKTVGSCYFGKRPVLVISNDRNNRYSKTITALPCSSRVSSKRPLPTHVYIPCGKGGAGLTRDTIVMCENICNYSVEILEDCIGEIDESSELMREIEKAVQIQIGIIG